MSITKPIYLNKLKLHNEGGRYLGLISNHICLAKTVTCIEYAIYQFAVKIMVHIPDGHTVSHSKHYNFQMDKSQEIRKKAIVRNLKSIPTVALFGPNFSG